MKTFAKLFLIILLFSAIGVESCVFATTIIDTDHSPMPISELRVVKKTFNYKRAVFSFVLPSDDIKGNKLPPSLDIEVWKGLNNHELEPVATINNVNKGSEMFYTVDESEYRLWYYAFRVSNPSNDKVSAFKGVLCYFFDLGLPYRSYLEPFNKTNNPQVKIIY